MWDTIRNVCTIIVGCLTALLVLSLVFWAGQATCTCTNPTVQQTAPQVRPQARQTPPPAPQPPKVGYRRKLTETEKLEEALLADRLRDP